MIEARLHRNASGRLTGFRVSGHAGMAPAGSDIVCAGVSALTQACLLGLLQYLRLDLDYLVEDDLITCRLPQGLPAALADQMAAICETMVLGLEEIARQYPQFIRIVR